MVTAKKNHKKSVIKTFLWILSFFRDKDPRIRYGIIGSLVSVFLLRLCSTALPLLFRYIINNLSMEIVNDHSFVQLLFIALGVAWTFTKMGDELIAIGSGYSLEHGIHLLSLKIFRHLHTLSLRFHVDKQTGSLVKAIDRTHYALESVCFKLFFFIVPTFIEMFIIVGVFTYLYGIGYGGILFGIALLYFSFFYYGVGRLDILYRSYNEKHNRAGAKFVDSLLNAETIKYFHNQQYEEEKFETILQEKEDIGIKLNLFHSLFNAAPKIIIGIGYIILMWKAGNAVFRGTMTVGDFVLINSYIVQFTSPLSSLGYSMTKVKKAFMDMVEVIDLLHLQPEINDAPNAIDISSDTTAEICFSDVEFGYNKDRLILHKVSFTIPKGKMVAVVGSTGSGKSTIAKLLFRLYDVTGGSILFNNHDIRNITQQSLHQAIAVVAQETNLFNDTLYYNVAYARPTATKAEVEKAIEDAYLTDFIEQLPEGYNTVVGERGLKLSGGEKQRIAIARALLKNPAMYIFDEATSSLDNHTERAIHQNLKQIAEGKTTLIIAHRLSTIVHADEIIVLHEGVIVERGTHEELLEQGKVYYDLWYNQENSTM